VSRGLSACPVADENLVARQLRTVARVDSVDAMGLRRTFDGDEEAAEGIAERLVCK
jgi:hypothetical protein